MKAGAVDQHVRLNVVDGRGFPNRTSYGTVEHAEPPAGNPNTIDHDAGRRVLRRRRKRSGHAPSSVGLPQDRDGEAVETDFRDLDGVAEKGAEPGHEPDAVEPDSRR